MLSPAFLGAAIPGGGEFDLVWIQDDVSAETGDWYLDLNTEIRLDQFAINNDYVEFDIFIPNGAYLNRYLNLIGRVDAATNTTNSSSVALLNNGDLDSRIRMSPESGAASLTFPYIHDGGTHTVKIQKNSSTTYEVAVDGTPLTSATIGAPAFYIGAIGIRRGPLAIAIGGGVIVKNFKIYQGGAFVVDMTINDGKSTIKNNGTGPDGTLIGVENTDYEWVKI